MTVVEMVLSMSLLSLILLASAQVSTGSAEEAEALAAKSRLNRHAHEALFEIARDLRQSAFSANGSYPAILSPTETVDEGWSVGSPNPAAEPGSILRNVVFIVPADSDGDDRPDANTAGEIIWSTLECAYVIVPDPLGRNRVERWVDGAFERIVCRHVEAFAVDSDQTAATEVPFGSLRIRLDLATSVDGRTLTERAQTTIRLSATGVEL